METQDKAPETEWISHYKYTLLQLLPTHDVQAVWYYEDRDIPKLRKSPLVALALASRTRVTKSRMVDGRPQNVQCADMPQSVIVGITIDCGKLSIVENVWGFAGYCRSNDHPDECTTHLETSLLDKLTQHRRDREIVADRLMPDRRKPLRG